MPVPSAITDLSTTAASNSPSGSEVRTTADDYLRALAGFIALVRDGSKNLEAGSASAPSLAFAGDANNGYYSPGADRQAWTTAGTKRLELDAAGNVSQGAFVPSAWGSGFRGIDVASAGNGFMGSTTGPNVCITDGTYYDGTNWKYTVSGQAVGYMQLVAGAAAFGRAPAGTAGNTASLTTMLSLDTSGNLTATGNVSAYSDIRYKFNLAPFAPSVADVAKLDTFTYDDEDGNRRVGVSAQQLREVMPLAVLEDADGRLSVDYGRAALLACIALAKKLA